MNKRKAAIYFSLSVVLIFSFALILASKENKKESPEIVGDYQFWETESASAYDVAEIFHTSAASAKMDNKKSESRKTTAKNAAKSRKTAAEEEYVYIDINSAGADELVKLKGIGDVMAERIIEYRNNFGPFIQESDIMNVSGIGEKTYNDIREHIYVTISEEDYARIQAEREAASEEEAPPEEETIPPDENSLQDKPDDEDTLQETTQQDIPVLDINTAEVSDFEKLPGIDRETAENIVKLRTAITKFTHVYELLYAENMTESRLAEILDYVYVKKTEQ